MTATELKKRAIALAEKTKIDSVTPEEVGQLSNDIVEYIENVEINGSSLGIRKTYTSVSAMEADSTAPKDDKGVLLRRGMLVNIYNQEYPESADNGKVFSFQNPGWAFRGTVDAGYATKEELTELAKFTYTNSEKGNYFIKELFFSEKFITEKNWENIYLYQVRRNQDGNWMLIFSDDKVGTNSFALQIKEELSFLYNEFVYAIVNWNTYEQGTHFETDKIKINKEISFDSSFSPVINSFIKYINSSQLATITGDSKTKAASQFLVKQETEKLLPTLNYFSVSDDAYEASTFLKEIYLSEKFLESKAWDDLYIYQRRKNASGIYNIILSSDISATDSFSLNSLSEDNTLLGNELLDAYAVVNWDVIKNDGIDFKVLHLDINRAKRIQYAPYICNYISSKKIVLEPSVKNMNTQTNTDFSNLLKTIGKIPMLTWVDDDGIYDGVEKIRPVFEELGIPMTFGLIPPLSDIAHDAVTRKEYFLDLQKDGHHCTTHPKHDKWYGEIDVKTVESSLIDCMVELQSSGFLHSDYLIYTGYGDSYEEISENVKKVCKAGDTAG